MLLNCSRKRRTTATELCWGYSLPFFPTLHARGSQPGNGPPRLLQIQSGSGTCSSPTSRQQARTHSLWFSEAGVDSMRQFTIYALAVITPWQFLCHKVVVVWNRGISLTTKFGNDDTTRNSTVWLLNISNHLEMKIPLRMVQVDS